MIRKAVFFQFISRFLIFFLVFALTVPQPLYAQLIPLPSPGTLVLPSTSVYNPVLIRAVKFSPDDPLKFDFIIDKGDTKLSTQKLLLEAKKLTGYFLASLTIPEKDLWVNLSPYEKDRIAAPAFGQTEMGRDLLAQDYLLKQLMASLSYPEEKLGKEFWRRVHEKAQKEFGTTQIPLDNFNKVWIVPDKAAVFESQRSNTVFVIESRLKVMLEEDYLASSANAKTIGPADKVSGKNIAGQVIREVFIPELEREVNEGALFAPLRQIYQVLILANWYKRKLKGSLLEEAYLDQNKIKGIDLKDKQAKEKIYQQYVEAYKKGAYNYIKEEYDPAQKQVIPRKYFSGGVDLLSTAKVSEELPEDAALTTPGFLGLSAAVNSGEAIVVSAGAAAPLAINNSAEDPASLVDNDPNKKVAKAIYSTQWFYFNLPGLSETLSKLDVYNELKEKEIAFISDPEGTYAPVLMDENKIVVRMESANSLSVGELAALIIEELIVQIYSERSMDVDSRWSERRLRDLVKIKTFPFRENVIELLEKYIPDPTNFNVDEFNARHVLSILDQLSLPKIRWMEEELTEADKIQAREQLLDGKIVVMLFAAGEASRLWRSLEAAGVVSEDTAKAPYRLWNLDPWKLAEEVAKHVDRLDALRYSLEEVLKSAPEAGREKLEEEIEELKNVAEHFRAGFKPPTEAKNIKQGARHLLALHDGLVEEAKKAGRDPGEVIRNFKLVVTANSEILNDVLSDLQKNKFFGFNPLNIRVVINDFYPGYIHTENGWQLDPRSADPKKGVTNFNHGYNLISARSKFMSYAFSVDRKRWVLQETPAFTAMRNLGASTAAVHRINDIANLDSTSSVDVDFLGMYFHVRRKGANVLVEALNNVTNEKGGFLLSREDIEDEEFPFLVEGLGLKPAIVQAKLVQLREEAKKRGLPNIPFNRMNQVFDIEDFENAINANDGVLPFTVKNDKPRPGVWSPELLTGDITILPGMRAVGIMRRKDRLIDSGILPGNEYYQPGSNAGAQLWNFKSLQYLLYFLAMATAQDRQRTLLEDAGLLTDAIQEPAQSIILGSITSQDEEGIIDEVAPGGVDFEEINAEVKKEGQGVLIGSISPEQFQMLNNSQGLGPMIYSIQPFTPPMLNLILGKTQLLPEDDSPIQEESQRDLLPEISLFRSEEETVFALV